MTFIRQTKTPKVDGFIEEIFELKRSHELLEEIFYEIGPYRNNEVSCELWEKIRTHFNFDDSE
jgi:hypothetical protein